MVVTIDGPAGAGKSTVARALAARLGFRFLDTGAMYRAVALAALERNWPWKDPQRLASKAQGLQIELRDQQVLLDGQDVTERIRSTAVTSVVHLVADNPAIRRQLVALQRAVACGHHVVTEGRDQGTLAFPDAECKIFLTASAAERADRRLRDLQSRGESVSFEDVLQQQNQRDRRDAARPLGRLQPAEDAIEVITDGLTPTAVIDRLEEIVRQKM